MQLQEQNILAVEVTYCGTTDATHVLTATVSGQIEAWHPI